MQDKLGNSFNRPVSRIDGVAKVDADLDPISGEPAGRLARPGGAGGGGEPRGQQGLRAGRIAGRLEPYSLGGAR